MQFLNSNIAPIGLGCWPIGGEMFAADGQSLGYSNSNDKESINAIQAAIANGITLFDTAAAYGAGHSERLLGQALKSHPHAQIVTKIGIAIDESKKMLIGDEVEPKSVMPAIDRCLARLDRESKSYGWSTDFVASAKAMANRPGFVAVEHAMHVLMDAPNMQKLVHESQLYSLIRSPLAMGLLSGKYTTETSIPKDDIRATNQGWLAYYVDGKPNPKYIDRFNAVRELLQTGGRTAVQGALSWLWAKSPNNIPIPGARTVEQIEGLAAAIAHGPLPEQVVSEVADLVGGENESEGESEG